VADFYREAARADGDDSLLQLIDPPPLLEVIGAICGGDDLRCIHIQPRTVPPEDEGGYTSWHRDMQDVNSVAVSFPTDGRVVKAIIYLHDCPVSGGANGVVRGSHKLPFSPREVYGKHSRGRWSH
jgi:ectoine hydroxylase-related dioxygenase (phytanoyl-CoA dioxygenase family)